MRSSSTPGRHEARDLAGRGAACLAIDAEGDGNAVALPALRHRVMTNFEAEAEGKGVDAILQNLIETTPPQAAA